MPVRIQRKRKAGWTMPPGAVYVGRPTVFGNPYDLETFGRRLALELFAQTARGCWSPQLLKGQPDEMAQAAYSAHYIWLERIGDHPAEEIQARLRGMDLCCWCEPHTGCHADTLLEIANAGRDG